MWYLLFGIAAGAWILRNAASRKTNGLKWAALAVPLAPVAVPLYLCNRPLMQGEVREGGKAYHGFRSFALVWSFFMGALVLNTMITHGGFTSFFNTLVYGFFWFVGVGGALMLGTFMKNSTVVERGE